MIFDEYMKFIEPVLGPIASKMPGLEDMAYKPDIEIGMSAKEGAMLDSMLQRVEYFEEGEADFAVELRSMIKNQLHEHNRRSYEIDKLINSTFEKDNKDDTYVISW